MNFLIGLLTVVLALDCVLLILLVLIQLPKKDAGAGLAFGGSTTDALFGAGSGNALTKITKYAAGAFFGLAIILVLLNSHLRKAESTLQLPKDWQNAPRLSPPPVTPAPEAAKSTVAAPVAPVVPLAPAPVGTNAPVAP
jgi:protein translocase SecG subunit